MRLRLSTQIFIGIILGVIIGLLLGERAELFSPVGDIFIQLLRMIIIPLILASIVMGMVGIGDVRRLGRIGLRTFVYYLATTLLAVTVGLIMVNVLHPGVGVELGLGDAPEVSQQEPLSLKTVIADIIPKNLFSAMAEDKVLSIIFFAILLGCALTTLGDKGRSLVNFFDALNDVMMKITEWIMRLAPFGVFALMVSIVGRLGIEALGSMAWYMLTVLCGLAVHAFITLTLLLSFIGRYSPVKLFQDTVVALATAFSTSSSAVTLPLTMESLQKNTGVSNRVSSFVLPLGATVNMDGTALYEAVAAMFIAQAYGITMGFSQQVIIMLTATLASIGAAAIPSAGLFTMVIVLTAVNLPLEGIAFIWAVDRVLDMCRTTVNVWGDSCGTTIVARLEGEPLKTG